MQPPIPFAVLYMYKGGAICYVTSRAPGLGLHEEVHVTTRDLGRPLGERGRDVENVDGADFCINGGRLLAALR